jgi:hypothetical protein
MKKDIVFFIMAILLFLLSCKEENTLQFNNQEEIMVISHGRYYGECVGYCERVLELKSDSTKIILKKPDSQNNNQSDTIYNQFPTSKLVWDSLIASFSLDSFMLLDSVDYPLGSVDEGHTWIFVKTNLRERLFSFSESDTIEVINKFNAILWDLRNSYAIDKIVIN